MTRTWKKVRLVEVASIFNGKTPSKSEQRTEGHPVLKIRDVSAFGNFRGKFESFVTPEFADRFASKQVRSGDILILNAAHNAEYVASKTYRAQPPAFGSLATGEWLIIRPDDGILHPDFAYHWVNSKATIHTLRDLINGIHLYPKDVARLNVYIPSFSEQRRIGIVLDRAATLRSKRREALAQLDELAQSMFLEMFSEAQSRGWIPTTVAGVAHTDRGSIRTGPFGSQLLHSEFVDSGVAVLGIDNVVANEFRWADRRFITENKYRELKRYTVQPGDVLITIMGTCGRCAVAPDGIPQSINTKHLCCITLDRAKCLPIFLHAYFLRHPVAHQYLRQTAKGAIMSGLNMGIIKAMPLLLPPLALQQEFADLAEGVERLKASHRDHLAELDALFASLQYQAFRGEL